MDDTDVRLGLLWEEARAGSESAYREFLTALAPRLRTYVRKQLIRLGRADGEAEDIVQETLIVIHSKRHAYEQDVPIIAWAYAITRYKLIDFLRASEKTAGNFSLDEIEETVGANVASVEVSVLVRRIFAALPEKMSRSIGLTKLQGMSVRETATITGMSEAAVKVNVHRGLKAIAQAFGWSGHDKNR